MIGVIVDVCFHEVPAYGASGFPSYVVVRALFVFVGHFEWYDFRVLR